MSCPIHEIFLHIETSPVLDDVPQLLLGAKGHKSNGSLSCPYTYLSSLDNKNPEVIHVCFLSFG